MAHPLSRMREMDRLPKASRVRVDPVAGRCEAGALRQGTGVSDPSYSHAQTPAAPGPPRSQASSALLPLIRLAALGTFSPKGAKGGEPDGYEQRRRIIRRVSCGRWSCGVLAYGSEPDWQPPPALLLQGSPLGFSDGTLGSIILLTKTKTVSIKASLYVKKRTKIAIRCEMNVRNRRVVQGAGREAKRVWRSGVWGTRRTGVRRSGVTSHTGEQPLCDSVGSSLRLTCVHIRRYSVKFADMRRYSPDSEKK